jgi:recombination DNA repair RAD52 pathway protein
MSDKSEIVDEEMAQQISHLANYYHFGEVAFAPEDQENIQKQLQTKLPKEFITWRVGPGGRKIRSQTNSF